ncbi:hypothetical protein [Stagnihabitans tardus]|uniref:Uncharacterized protein n=1 Tax=Stagnihabitans tardus TaxID=2699202 RepID=A0AAE5BVM6_9RHOB|nr:hypothetical protein [Stagnihabitans tardus]NBZ89121.1 hypothetical protein [Stagnihabitans tardus]
MRFLLPLFLLAVPVEAQPTEGPAARLMEAHRLAALGETARDPVLLFAAARLMQGLQLTETPLSPADPTTSAEPSTEGSAEPTPDPAATVPDPAKAPPLPGQLSAPALFDAARALAPEDSALREAITLAASEIPPPPALLQVSLHSQEGSQSFALPLPGGSPVQIGLLRLKGALSYSLSAPDGMVLCQDASTSAASLCTVTLPESQTLTLTTTGTADWLLAQP